MWEHGPRKSKTDASLTQGLRRLVVAFTSAVLSYTRTRHVKNTRSSWTPCSNSNFETRSFSFSNQYENASFPVIFYLRLRLLEKPRANFTIPILLRYATIPPSSDARSRLHRASSNNRATSTGPRSILGSTGKEMLSLERAMEPA